MQYVVQKFNKYNQYIFHGFIDADSDEEATASFEEKFEAGRRLIKVVAEHPKSFHRIAGKIG